MLRTMVPWEKKRTLMVKAEEETDPKLGHIPTERPIDYHIKFGVISLDKPAGPSSHEVTAWVKRILGAKHVGHGGTLEAHWELGTPQSDRSSADCFRRSNKGYTSYPPVR